MKPDREILGYEEVGGDTVDLTKAEIIVAVGRGVGGADKMAPVEELAKALGAEIGASRPVIDNGWLPRDRQIGSSGQTVAPKLYIAAGISGAIQHLVGMKGSTVIVAINKDPGAPIFTVADYGIVGDLHEVLPAITEAVRPRRGERALCPRGQRGAPWVVLKFGGTSVSTPERWETIAGSRPPPRCRGAAPPRRLLGASGISEPARGAPRPPPFAGAHEEARWRRSRRATWSSAPGSASTAGRSSPPTSRSSPASPSPPRCCARPARRSRRG